MITLRWIVLLLCSLPVVVCTSWAQCPEADLTQDCAVTIFDLAQFADQWLASGDCPGNGCADLVGHDNFVNLADFDALAAQWGQYKVTLVINEIMADNVSTIRDPEETNPDNQYADWIELYNYGPYPIDIGGMTITDNLANPLLWRIPSNRPDKTVIGSGEYLLLWADKDMQQGPLHVDIKINAELGESIGLYDWYGNRIDMLNFGPQIPDQSLGRLPDGAEAWQVFNFNTSGPTPGYENGTAPPPGKIVISEIMYHPFNEDDPEHENPLEEYVEITNIGGQHVNLAGWQFTRGIQFMMPPLLLEPGDQYVIVSDMFTFMSKYPGVVNIIGNFNGKLSNSGEMIELVDPSGNVMDQVRYADNGDWGKRVLGPIDHNHRGWQWQAVHDGQGSSLELMNPLMNNDYGANWAASVVSQGTPGVTNSVITSDIAPVIFDVAHEPIIPTASDTVTVSAHIMDDSLELPTVQLYWRIDASTYSRDEYPGYDPNDFTVVEMSLVQDGIYTAFVPPLPDKTIVEYFITAIDTTGNVRSYPVAADIDGQDQQVANLLYQVLDGFDAATAWQAGDQPIHYLIMTESERARLAYIGSHSYDCDSNAQMNSTFITLDGSGLELRYNAGIRNRGKGSRTAQPNNYRVNIPSDRPWKNVTAVNFNGRYAMEEIIGSAIFRMAGMPAQQAAFAQVRVNGQNLAVNQYDMFGAYARLEAEDGDMVDVLYPDDSAGNYYRGIRRLTDNSANADFSYDGPVADATHYTWDYTKQTNSAENDYSDIIALCRAFSRTETLDDNFVREISEHINVKQWLRYFAMISLIGDRETTLGTGVGDDFSLYRGIIDPRFRLIVHDLDTILGQGDTAPDIDRDIFKAADISSIRRLLRHPVFAPMYYAELQDLMNTVFSEERVDSVFNQVLGGIVPESQILSMKAFVSNRKAAVLAQMPLDLTIECSLPVISGFPQTMNSTLMEDEISGLANVIETRSVRIQGLSADYQPETGEYTLTEPVSLYPGINRIVIQAFADPNGIGSELERAEIDVWYNDGDESTIGGTLASDTLLNASSGPWHVTSTLVVPADVTLTIEPGTTLLFDSSAGLTVHGRIVAEGEDFARIRFNHAFGSSGWQSIEVSNTDQDNRLVYVDVEYGGSQSASMDVDNARIVMDFMTFSGTSTKVVEFHNPKAVVRNSVFPSVGGSEPLHGTGLSGDQYMIFDQCVFGSAQGYNDIIDFTGGSRPGPIFQVYNSVFLGGGDDGPDLDSTDAHVEGNLFMNFHQWTSDQDSPSYGVATGDGSEVCVVRNVFINNDHCILHKEDVYSWFANNTCIGSEIAAISFGEPFRSSPRTPGRGIFADSNIFWDNAAIFEHLYDNPPDYGPEDVYIYRSILPDEWQTPPTWDKLGQDHPLGLGNFSADPQFIHEYDNLRLRSGSSAIGTGATGLDRGAYVPAGAAVFGEILPVIWRTEMALDVSGPGITHYKWRLVDNGTAGSWSQEIALPIDSTDFPSDPNRVFGRIELTGLEHGHTYRVDVIGKNSADHWQGQPFGENTGFVAPGDPEGNQSPTWTVDTTYSSLMLNEVLARNAETIEVNGSYPNMIELYYDAPGDIGLDLSGMTISDDPTQPDRYTFPVGTQILPGQYLVLYADTDMMAPGIHLGFALDGEGDGVYLYDSTQQAIDSVEFGLQLPGLTIGRTGYHQQWALCEPTLGSVNTLRPTGDLRHLKINEWLANNQIRSENDFVELYNPQANPVRLDGLHLTDNPISQSEKFTFPPLSFIGGDGYLALIADGNEEPGHLNFKLSSEGELIALYDVDGVLIDQVIYYVQTPDISEGRLPNGGEVFTLFDIPTPGVANPGTVTTITTTVKLVEESAPKRVLIPTAEIEEAWKGGDSFDDNLWNDGIFVDGKLGGVGYETNTGSSTSYVPVITYDVMALHEDDATGSCYIRIPFALSAEQVAGMTSLTLRVKYDDAFIAYINGVKGPESGPIPSDPVWNSFATGNGQSDSLALQFADFIITDTQTLQSLHEGENILAIHAMDTEDSTDFLFSVELDLVIEEVVGEDTMGKMRALQNDLRISELMYYPGSGETVEFIELTNIGSDPLDITGVRFIDGVEFTMPEMLLDPGAYIVVTNDLAGFRNKYSDAPVVAGVYQNRLNDSGESIVLALPVPYDAAILRFNYAAWWYPVTSGGGYSLVTVDLMIPYNEYDIPENWIPSIEIGGSPGSAEPSL
ncbi:MAG: lamin tail domain-containing protein [Sedimentisphaerales bacterium]|nr:lamin tail domain-containing protein [Sedimentisphaerales bacterium]